MGAALAAIAAGSAIVALATVTRRPELERVAIALGSAGVVALTALSWVGNYVP